MSDEKKGKIVVMGGGTGQPVLLRGLKGYPIDLTAIVTVADDGGSSGILRHDLNIPPPGDIRNVLAALSDVEPLIEGLFQHRFQGGKELSGHALGNLLLAAMTSITGDFVSAIGEMSKVLNVNGKVLPAANQSIVLHAEMDDGTIVSGESKIPDVNKKINRVYLTPEDVKPLNETLIEIENADIIVIGPGSLYTSILPNLLVPEIGKAVCESKAKKVYICNIMTQPGETINYTASEHIKALYDHIGCSFIDIAIVNNEMIEPAILNRYQLENAAPVIYDLEALNSLGLKVISESLVHYDTKVIRHDTEKISNIVFSLLE